MTDFFISYTHTDAAWAEWISYVLEEEGFSVIVQAWDFRPGNNFVLEMQEAASKADRTLLVLSPSYLQSQFASPEWAAAFGQDPQGRAAKLVPVMIETCHPKGLLTTIIQIRIAGKSEADARAALLAGISQRRAKPSARPGFPGAVHIEHKTYPGPGTAPLMAAQDRPVANNFIPPLKRNPTDIEKRRFVKAGFEAIKTFFETNLGAVAHQESRIETDFQLSTATDFRAEMFLDGKSKCVCRVWLGGMHSDNNICYSESRYAQDNSCNEILSLPQSDELQFHALLAMSPGGHPNSSGVGHFKLLHPARPVE